jgi:predicted RND superfamily exporter protein
MERQRSRDLLIVTVFIVAAAVSLLGIGRLKVDSSTDAFIPAKAPVVETNNRIEKQFGSLDALVVSLYDEGGIINKESLAVIDSLTRRLKRWTESNRPVPSPTSSTSSPRRMEWMWFPL